MESLKRQRASVEQTLNFFANFISKIEAEFAVTALANPTKTLIEIQRRLAAATPLLSQFLDLQMQIQAQMEDSSDEVAIQEQFTDLYYSSTSTAEYLCSKISPCKPEGIPSAELSAFNGGQIPTSNNPIKLPVINLPRFSGEIEFWLEYRDLYKSLIHDNDSITPIQKFHYLRASLSGDALLIIKSLEFSGDNYLLAWESLCERYNNSRMLIYNHIKALLNLETLNKESGKKIRHLHDMLFKHVNALKSLSQSEDLFDTLVIHLISSKLDSHTAREWETLKNSKGTNLPTLDDFKGFLKNTADLLDTLSLKQDKINSIKVKVTSKSFVSRTLSCILCKKNHNLYACPEFLQLSVADRLAKVKELYVCFNCLTKGHSAPQCSSKFTCRTCKKRHHSLLHEQSVNRSLPPDIACSGNQSITAFASNTVQVLLPTATANVIDSDGSPLSVRILLDSGSQSNFITSRVCKKLDLSVKPVNISVTGLSTNASQVQSSCSVQIQARHSSFKLELSCLVIDKITNTLPGFCVNTCYIQIPDGVQLSDPLYYKPGEVDILIGSSEFWNLLCEGRVHLGPQLPTLQNTRLGWVISGSLPNNNNNQVVCHFARSDDVNFQLSKFWEIEQYPTEKAYSQEENACESIFVQTHKRAADGRFIVQIPFKQSPSLLGDSLQIATKRFLSLEKRLQGNNVLRQRYNLFMTEYENLGHMTKVESNHSEISYYLPHHGVLKENSLSTKLRVVFDGSAQTTTGHSLNSLQMVGPVIQQDLFSILLRFRKFRYAISADIEKMYRQVLIDPDQRPLQSILWRPSPQVSLETYNLNTVTYGTASASFLAIRSLIQLGIECENLFPDVSKVIKQDFYVDDLLTGSDSLSAARDLCKNIQTVCMQGGFKLCKWISNEPQVLKHINKNDIHPGLHEFGSHENTRTLGLLWCFKMDEFMFSISDPSSTIVTKRTILSAIAQIFDPLGLLGPCTILVKMLLQQLWLERLSWDDPVPGHILDKWNSFCHELPILNDCRIPRQVICPNSILIELHGFSDASMHGYGACIYLKSINDSGIVYVSLLCAKSKVAPLKPLTIPKLELCAATLLSKLFTCVYKALNIQFTQCFLWTDSTIVLGWLNTPPNLTKTFVCNRIADIQERTSNCVWRHVPSKFNPADLLSRGLLPHQLLDSLLWWKGPHWLQEGESQWPPVNPTLIPSALPELKGEATCFHVTAVYNDPFPISRFSNFNRLVAVVAYCKRFINNCRNPFKRLFGPLSCKELQESTNEIIKISQAESFANELNSFNHNRIIKASGTIGNLHPFLDSNGIIRVGGRLDNSNYSFDKIHPVILSNKHHLSILIMRSKHFQYHHPGPQLLLALVREEFWITNGRSLARKVVHACVRCFRFSAKITNPIMGSLPASRVQPAPPFSNVGVDYAGPFTIKDRKGRGCKTSKSYLCLFVCFATKAVHLELVTALSTESFLTALRRFVARRGKPSNIYSDHGTNFVGANSALKELGEFLVTQKTVIPEINAREGITWHFIPPYSPHFGGLWEAGVKSVKHHLKRITSNVILTYEEFSTLFCQIEAILNSRPLTPLSSDPHDLNPLTPAHFLIGRTLTAIPDSDYTSIPPPRLSSYQAIQSMQQHFWKRWNKEYISELQCRTKWQSNKSELKVDTLVLIKEDNQPPLYWKMGRIVHLHPGRDGVSRVASISTANGVICRSFSKICPLPLDNQ